MRELLFAGFDVSQKSSASLNFRLNRCLFISFDNVHYHDAHLI